MARKQNAALQPWKRHKKHYRTGETVRDEQGREVFEWYITLPLPGGKQRQVFLADMDASPEDIRRALADALSEHAVESPGAGTPGARPGVASVIARFLDYVRNHLKPATYRIRRQCLGSFLAFLESRGLELMPVTDLRMTHVEDWLIWQARGAAAKSGDRRRRKWGDNMRRMALLSLQTCLSYAVEREIIGEAERPLRGLHKLIPQEVYRGDEVVLTAEQVGYLIRSCTHQGQKQLLRGLYSTGCRPGEAINLDIEDVVFGPDGRGGQRPAFWRARGKKTKRNPTGERLVALEGTAVLVTEELLAEHAAAGRTTGPLFLNTVGGRWEVGLVNAFVRRARHRVERLTQGEVCLPRVIPYGMRHTFATDLLANGAHDYDVAKLLGHQGTKMVHTVYAKHTVEVARRALAGRDTSAVDEAAAAPQLARRAPTAPPKRKRGRPRKDSTTPPSSP
jgi:integrase